MAEDEEAADYFAAEFQALRSEIDRRSTAQQAILALQLTGAGLVATLATRDGGNPYNLMLVPPLGLALATMYVNHHVQIMRIGTYLRQTWEERLPGRRTWEAWTRDPQNSPPRTTGLNWRASPWFLFFGTGLATTLWATYAILGDVLGGGVPGPVPYVGWAVDVVCTVFTALQLRPLSHRPPAVSPTGPTNEPEPQAAGV